MTETGSADDIFYVSESTADERQAEWHREHPDDPPLASGPFQSEPRVQRPAVDPTDDNFSKVWGRHPMYNPDLLHFIEGTYDYSATNAIANIVNGSRTHPLRDRSYIVWRRPRQALLKDADGNPVPEENAPRSPWGKRRKWKLAHPEDKTDHLP